MNVSNLNNWRLLTVTEEDKAWDMFYSQFSFKPSTDKEDWPSVKTNLPQLKLDIRSSFDEDFPTEKIEMIALELFTKITQPGDRLYALDWQHQCYDFDPRKEMDRDHEFNTWTVPLLPNGDYFIFATSDLSNVWFGHPWEESITLIGHEIVESGKLLLDDLKEFGIVIYPGN